MSKPDQPLAYQFRVSRNYRYAREHSIKTFESRQFSDIEEQRCPQCMAPLEVDNDGYCLICGEYTGDLA